MRGTREQLEIGGPTRTDGGFARPRVRSSLHGSCRGSFRGSFRGRAGFTLVELLVTVGLIILLLSLLIVALSAAGERAQQAKTSVLMRSITQGLAQFENDFGDLPPILGGVGSSAGPRDLYVNQAGDVAPPDPNGGGFGQELQAWRSITSLAEYLVGYGEAGADGYGDIARGVGPQGIREPGFDLAWGATANAGGGTAGEISDRRPRIEGPVYGPYLQIDDVNLLGSYDASLDRVFLPSEAGFDENDPRVIVDYWGNPIVYHRDHPGTATANGEPIEVTLGDVIALRPFSMEGESTFESPVADANGDATAPTWLKSAKFALFSAGPDRRFNAEARYDAPPATPDPDEYYLTNEDNLVEAGR